MTTIQQQRTTLVFVDTETTGLQRPGSRAEHEIWEVGAISTDRSGKEQDQRRWFLPVNLGHADPFALRLGNFYERYPLEGLTDWPARDWPNQVQLGKGITHPHQFAREFERMTRDAVLIGSNVSFDEERLHRLMVQYGACPSWDYHKMDAEQLAIGFLAAQGQIVDLPFTSSSLSDALGLDRSKYTKHEALSDAQWARDVYGKIGMFQTPTIQSVDLTEQDSSSSQRDKVGTRS